MTDSGACIVPLDGHMLAAADRGEAKWRARAARRSKTERASQVAELVDALRFGAAAEVGALWIVDGNYGDEWYAFFWRRHNSMAERRSVNWMMLARLAVNAYARAEYDLPPQYVQRAVSAAFGGADDPEAHRFMADLAEQIRERAAEQAEAYT